MAQATFAAAQPLGQLSGLTGYRSQKIVETPRSSDAIATGYGLNGAHPSVASKSTRWKSKGLGGSRDGCSFPEVDYSPYMRKLSQVKGVSRRFQATWKEEHDENGPQLGSSGRAGLYMSRRASERPTFGATRLQFLTQNGSNNRDLRKPAPVRFQTGTLDRTQSLERCSQIEGDEFTLSLTSFNILAPIYYRKWEGKRESEEREAWWERNKKIVEMLEEKRSSIICLQVRVP